MPSPFFDTTTVPGVRILDGTSDGRDIDEGFKALAQDLGPALGSFRANRVTTQSTGANSGRIVFDVEEWDVSNWYASATGIFTPQLAGIYRLSALVGSISNGVVYAATLVKSGVDYHQGTQGRGAVTQVDSSCSLVSALVAANGTTDAFHVRIPTNVINVGAANEAKTLNFQGELVGRT